MDLKLPRTVGKPPGGVNDCRGRPQKWAAGFSRVLGTGGTPTRSPELQEVAEPCGSPPFSSFAKHQMQTGAQPASQFEGERRPTALNASARSIACAGNKPPQPRAGATLSACTAHGNSIVVNGVSWSQASELTAGTAPGEIIAMYSFLLPVAHFLPFLREA